MRGVVGPQTAPRTQGDLGVSTAASPAKGNTTACTSICMAGTMKAGESAPYLPMAFANLCLTNPPPQQFDDRDIPHASLSAPRPCRDHFRHQSRPKTALHSAAGRQFMGLLETALPPPTAAQKQPERPIPRGEPVGLRVGLCGRGHTDLEGHRAVFAPDKTELPQLP